MPPKKIIFCLFLVLIILFFPQPYGVFSFSLFWRVENFNVQPINLTTGDSISVKFRLVSPPAESKSNECAKPGVEFGDGRVAWLSQCCSPVMGKVDAGRRSICDYSTSHAYQGPGKHTIAIWISLPPTTIAGLNFKNLASLDIVVATPAPLAPLADSDRVNPLRATSINQLLEGIGGIIYWIGTGVLLLMILLGGFSILAAAGDPAKVQQGKKIVIYSLIGFSIMVMSRGIIELIIVVLGRKQQPS